MKPSLIRKRTPALALGLTVAGFAAAACGMGTGLAGAEASADPLRCELRITERGGSTTIEGRVSAERVVQGSYRLAIAARSGGGSAMINQSGDFEVRPGAPAELGQTTLGGSAARYTADLEIRVNGQRLRCLEQNGTL
ncbi:MAG: hypothetical protein JJU19_02960 [Pararhodobacter sp.]|nr:hypothetical protein [Pararhodobacter sp.]